MSYNEIATKIGVDQDRPVVETIYDSGVVNVGSGPIQLPNNPIKSNYPIDSLLVTLKVAITLGTGTLQASPIFNALNNLELTDKNNVDICNFLGTDVIAEAYLRSWIINRGFGNNRLPGTLGAGTTSLTTNFAAGSQEVNVLLRFPVAQKELPLKIKGAFAANSALFSTVGTATATVELILTAIMYPTVNPVWTVRTQKTNNAAALPVATGNDLTKMIPDSLVIDQLLLQTLSDSNWTASTLDPNGNKTGYQQITQDQQLQMETAELAPTTRQTGYIIYRVGQFVKSSKTFWTLDVGTGFTPATFVMYHQMSDQPAVKAVTPAVPASPAASAAANASG